MEIEELFLQHYGKFDNHRIPLKPGINVIYGENEAGKTTIHSFIRAMLFGLNRGRGKAARNGEYQIRQPWDTPGAFLGSMRIRCRGQVYRIDRCFDRSAQPLRVTCETTMWESPDPERALEVLLGGVSEASFANTLCIPQAGGETGEALAQELRRYLINSDSSRDSRTDVSDALQSLRRRRKQAEQQKKKEDEQMERRIAEKQAKAEQLRTEIRMLREQRGRFAGPDGTAGAEAQPRRADSGGPAQARDDGDEAFYQRSRWLIRILLLLTGLLSLAAAFFLRNKKSGIFLGICGVFFLALIFAVNFMFRAPDGGEAEDWDDSEESGPDAGRAEQPDPVSGGNGAGRGPAGRQDFYLGEEIRKREEAYRKLQDELEVLYQSHVRLDGADTEIAALTLAIDRICELSSGIFEQSGRKLNERASEILSELTGGRYSRILLDETAEVRIHTPSRVLGLSQVSGGTMQQIYFALRMASAELLCGEQQLPVLLDEPFAMYDDRRLEAALRWLRNSGRQVILFTCQSREREILERRIQQPAGKERNAR